MFDRPSEAALAHFDRCGWVLTRVCGSEHLASWVDEVAGSADPAVLHYREMTDDGPKLCRSENFVPSHAGLRSFLTEGPMVDFASSFLGEPAVLYKEKINYKLAGGAGYAAHQDAPAYPFIDVHVSCMVAVDDSTSGNGCLEVVSSSHAAVLPVDERGCLPEAVATRLTWTAVEVRAGEALWFHSRTPHRSGPNRSSVARRAIYPTYNAASQGDLRTEYYREKLDMFAAAGDSPDRVRVSLIGDFQGKPVQ